MNALLCLLCGFYVEGSVSILADVSSPPPGAAWMSERTVARNPYGIAALGYLWTARSESLELFVELRHESSLATRADEGENGIRAGVRWFPARARQ